MRFPTNRTRRTLAAGLVFAATLLVCGGAVAALKTGTPGDDRLVGTPRNDELRGRGGDDKIIARAGNDLLLGGAGRDVLRGGRHRDFVDYREAKSGVTVDLRRGRASGGENDKLVSIESAAGSDHDDVLKGDASHNRLRGQAGDDTLVGRRLGDTIVAYRGRDLVRGGGGGDHILASGGDFTVVKCGPGRDRVTADRQDRLSDCERKFR